MLVLRTLWVGEFPCRGQEAPQCALLKLSRGCLVMSSRATKRLCAGPVNSFIADARGQSTDRTDVSRARSRLTSIGWILLLCVHLRSMASRAGFQRTTENWETPLSCVWLDCGFFRQIRVNRFQSGESHHRRTSSSITQRTPPDRDAMKSLARIGRIGTNPTDAVGEISQRAQLAAERDWIVLGSIRLFSSNSCKLFPAGPTEWLPPRNTRLVAPRVDHGSPIAEGE